MTVSALSNSHNLNRHHYRHRYHHYCVHSADTASPSYTRQLIRSICCCERRVICQFTLPTFVRTVLAWLGLELGGMAEMSVPPGVSGILPF